MKYFGDTIDKPFEFGVACVWASSYTVYGSNLKALGTADLMDMLSKPCHCLENSHGTRTHTGS